MSGANDNNDVWRGYFDFNAIRTPFRSLGAEAGAAVQLVADWSASNSDSRGLTIAALRAACLTLPRAIATAPEAGTVLDTICRELSRVEEALSQLVENGEPPALFAAPKRRGRPVGDLERQGRAVVAVQWLQTLKNGPMTKPQALVAVAKKIRTTARYHYHELSAERQLEAWQDSFSRKGDTERQRVLNNLRFEIWEHWCCSHRPLIGTDNDGLPLYGGLVERDVYDATKQDVLAWLANAAKEAERSQLERFPHPLLDE